MPIVPCRRIWRYERAERQCDPSGPRQLRLVTQNTPRTAHGHRANRTLCIYGGFESAQLERTNARGGRKGSFGIDHHRLPAFKRRIHLLRLADARLRIAAIKCKLAASARHGAKQRHIVNLTFDYEAHIRREKRQVDQNVEKARVIRSKNPGAGCFPLSQDLAPFHSHGYARHQ